MSLPYLHPYLGLSNGLNTLHAGGAAAAGGWVELGRTTLGSAGDTITVSSLADKRYYMILADILNDGTNNIGGETRLGNSSVDTGSNYATRSSTNGGADGTGTSATQIDGFNSTTTEGEQFHVGYLANLSGNEKLMIEHEVVRGIAGASNAPYRRELVGKWANTSNPLDIIQKYNSLTGSFNTNSELVVLGWDPADSHTNNFWEELYSGGTGASASSFTTGTITAKKYLWTQFMIKNDTGGNLGLQFNSDGGNNYAFRYSINGGADATVASTLKLQANVTSPTTYSFVNVFIINNSANEKLVILGEANQGTAGAGNAPNRWEVVGKWANTSNQITSMQIVPNSGNMTLQKWNVWGSD